MQDKTGMIQIKNISDTIILEAPITDSCEYVRELMKDDYIKLSFSHDTLIPLKEGSYIEYNSIKYSLLEPYEPAYKTEVSLLYEPVFHSPVSAWKKQTLFYTEQGLEEVDWTGTMTPVQFLSVIVGNLKKYRGDIYALAIDSELTGSKNIAFQSTSIFEALNKIAQAWETEWWVDGTVINLGKCSYGAPVKLESGVDTSIPSISASNDGYFTRFYAFGSTRNITQDYESGSVQNHIIQKRLKLPMSKYPNGYMDIRPNLRKGEIFTKTLIFDDIYPSSNLTVSETRAEVKFYLDGQGNKIEIGKDTSAQPIYKTYSIWYIKLGSFIFDESSIIEGLDLTAKFETGQLITREFKLVHRNGEYEIMFDESEGFVIPGEVSLIPAVGDKVVLFNIKMPQDYISSAEFKLEKELKKVIQKQSVDTNTYSFDSNPVEFNKTSLRLKVGQKISFVYQGRTIDTRVLSVRMRLDFPDIQNITIGDTIPKGTTLDLRQQVANANENIEIIKTLNDLRNDITNSYGHAQKELAEGFAKWGKLWTLEKDSKGNDYVFSSLPIAVQGGVTMFADAGILDLPSIYEEIPLGDGLIWKDGRIVVTVNGGLDEAALGSYLTTHTYATQTWVTNRLSNLHAHSNKSVLDTITSSKVSGWDSAYSHISDTTKHITAGERINWNTAFGWGNHATAGYALNSALSSHISDAVKHITTGERNTWNAKENALGNPITSGYLLSSTTTGARSWVKPFELSKDDVVRVLKDADGCIRLDAHMLLSGGLSMLSDLGFDVPSIFDNAPIATSTSKGVLDNSILGTGLSWVGGKLTATATAGTFDHTALSNRNSNNQHSIAAITGLQVALDGKSPIHSHPYRPDSWMPTAAQVGALGVNATAYNSTRLGGTEGSQYWRRGLGHVGADHTNYTSNGAFVDKMNTGWSGSQWVFGSYGSTSGLNFRNEGGGSKNLQVRFSIDGNRWDGGFRTIWDSGNFNPATKLGKTEMAADSNWANKSRTCLGVYTGNGGHQAPSDIGRTNVRFNMMNTPVNGNNHYKDWLLMDCYSGNDVGGAVALGINRQVLGAYIMRSESTRNGWSETAELYGTHNSNNTQRDWSANTFRGLALSLVNHGVTSSILSQNSGHLHYSTSAESHWFNTRVRVAGDIFAGPNYNQRVWHAGNLNPAEYMPLSRVVGGNDKITWIFDDTSNSGKLILELCDDLDGSEQFIVRGRRSYAPLKTIDSLVVKSNGNVDVACDLSMTYGYAVRARQYGNKLIIGTGYQAGYYNDWTKIATAGSASPKELVLGSSGKAFWDGNQFYLGDSDTGFYWMNDGHIRGVANGVNVFGWYNNTFYSLGKIIVGSGGDQELVTRHISGKHYQNDSDSDLYINWRSRLSTHTGGNLSIGGQNATCNATLHVHGNILADGGITMLSDMRLKNRISKAKSVLPYISSIDVFRYTLKSDVAKRIYIGVSAQQIQGLWSEFVYGVETLSLDYAQMGAYIAIKGLQESKFWMDSKDKKIAELEKRIVELEKSIA